MMTDSEARQLASEYRSLSIYASVYADGAAPTFSLLANVCQLAANRPELVPLIRHLLADLTRVGVMFAREFSELDDAAIERTLLA